MAAEDLKAAGTGGAEEIGEGDKTGKSSRLESPIAVVAVVEEKQDKHADIVSSHATEILCSGGNIGTCFGRFCFNFSHCCFSRRTPPPYFYSL